MSVFVVGSLHLDVVLSAPHLPRLDETVTGTSVDYVFGGKGGNQAVAAARLGADVAFAGRAGSDGFGDMLRAALRQTNVDISQLQKDDGPSGMSAAIVDAQGEYGAVIVSAANMDIDAAAIKIPAGTRVVLLQNEIPQEVNMAVAEQARAVGAQIWLNAAPVRDVPDVLAEMLDLMIVNRVEACAYAHPAVPTLETRGKDGVIFEGVNIAGYPVSIVSAHGAGDMFVGALAARVAMGQTIAKAIPFAQAAAALHVSLPLSERARLNAEKTAAFLEAQSNR
ncbi:MAG: PfkB family carbohydrate kinase [Paracoccaceae bacterium]|nr:PfkB family carbohydrate kinase [Paracoccaceae bacterium]